MQAHGETNGHGNGPKAQLATVDVGRLVAQLRDVFESGRTKTYAWRTGQLEALGRMLAENEREILDALRSDVGKPALEAYTAEVAYTAGEAAHARKSLRGWMKPERVSTPVISQPGTSRIHREPLGVALIIGPWNYPFQLVMGPLVGAIAAGNCVVLKPSEVAPAVSALVAKLVPKYLDTDCIAVVEGGVPETTALLEQRFDHIFYTGNGTVGRVVMAAAAKHLTPVTLELGGKSPCIVDRDVDLEVAAKRIAWGKFFNAGQTCVAPDYLLVHESVHDRLLQLLTRTVREFYGADPKASPDFGRIVNARHHQRLMKLLPGSGSVVVGGEGDEAARYLAPTILKDVPPDSPVMAGEIFGPILPVIKVNSIDEAMRFINARPKPLALYVYSTSDQVQQRVLDGTSSGGAVLNHCWLHLAVPGLPFGGVGESGMGAYHGKLSFETFSHRKAVLRKPTSIDPPIMYPPYTDSKEAWLRRLL
ncbi:MAG: aldehyde dehydrogenase family protein [Deltaproteobacteria bacterium]|nr:aldehyde dehydrogenase family protein [Deltaproteobacteria bacterium]